MIDQRLRALLPLFAAVFIDIFSFGLMYSVIIALFHDPIVVGVYRPAVRDAYLSSLPVGDLHFDPFRMGGAAGVLPGDGPIRRFVRIGVASRRWKASLRRFFNYRVRWVLPNFDVAVNPRTIMSIIALHAQL
jgi:hypothetical protein